MLDDDKNFDKNLTKIMVGGALLTNAFVFAVGFDVGYQSGAKRGKEPTIVHGNLTINNSINLNSDDAGSVSK
jgi:hypothetical protein